MGRKKRPNVGLKKDARIERRKRARVAYEKRAHRDLPSPTPSRKNTESIEEEEGGERWKDAEIPLLLSRVTLEPLRWRDHQPPFEKRDANDDDDDDDAFGGISSSREDDELNNPRAAGRGKREIFLVTLLRVNFVTRDAETKVSAETIRDRSRVTS